MWKQLCINQESAFSSPKSCSLSGWFAWLTWYIHQRKEYGVFTRKSNRPHKEFESSGFGKWTILVNLFLLIHMLSPKIENAHCAGEKRSTTRCGITETATTRNFVLWLFLNNRNALWHVKIRNDAKVVLWLLKEITTTSSDFMKIPQVVVVVTFYNHDAMWDKF